MRPPSHQDEAALEDAFDVLGRQERAEEDLPVPRQPAAVPRGRVTQVALDLVDTLARRVPLGPSAHLRAVSRAAAEMTGQVEQAEPLGRAEDLRRGTPPTWRRPGPGDGPSLALETP